MIGARSAARLHFYDQTMEQVQLAFTFSAHFQMYGFVAYLYSLQALSSGTATTCEV